MPYRYSEQADRADQMSGHRSGTLAHRQPQMLLKRERGMGSGITGRAWSPSRNWS